MQCAWHVGKKINPECTTLYSVGCNVHINTCKHTSTHLHSTWVYTSPLKTSVPNMKWNTLQSWKGKKYVTIEPAKCVGCPDIYTKLAAHRSKENYIIVISLVFEGNCVACTHCEQPTQTYAYSQPPPTLTPYWKIQGVYSHIGMFCQCCFYNPFLQEPTYHMCVHRLFQVHPHVTSVYM